MGFIGFQRGQEGLIRRRLSTTGTLIGQEIPEVRPSEGKIYD